MSNTSQIVSGGGWKHRHVERLKLKAWVMLFAAIVLGAVAVVGSDSLWRFAWIPAGLSFLTSLFLFFREKPREISVPGNPVGHDRGKLYGASGQQEREKEENV